MGLNGLAEAKLKTLIKHVQDRVKAKFPGDNKQGIYTAEGDTVFTRLNKFRAITPPQHPKYICRQYNYRG